MKRLRTLFIGLITAASFVALPLATTYAQNPPSSSGSSTCATPTDCIQQGADNTTQNGSGGGTDLKTFIKTIVNILLFVLGAIAVIMIIIGGIRYTTSNGDSSAIKGAKDTIFYAVIGLVVAILAYAIVNFVISSLVKS